MSHTNRLHALLQQQWQHGGWLANLLSPLSVLTGIVVKAKQRQYSSGKKTAWQAPVPVVIVGNILAGGTGKTPVVMAVVQALQARGWHPGVVSRGYGINVGPTPRVAQGTPTPTQIGDEPALIAAGTGVPVAVHPRRPLAVQALLKAHPHVDVVVSDHGLQHLALARDVEILVQDGRGVGNGRLLPAGPLREPASRLSSVDAIVSNATQAKLPPHAAVPRHTTMQLEPTAFVRLSDGHRLSPEAFHDVAANHRLAAAAGIGQPERFFATLRAANIHLTDTLPLPDHYDYRQSPFGNLNAEIVLVTAKDAVKCQALGDPRLWYVEVSPVFSDTGFFDWLDSLIRQRAVERGAAYGSAS